MRLFLPSSSHQECNPSSVCRAVCGLAPPPLTSSPSTLPLTLFQHVEHTLTSGPLHWRLPLFGGLLSWMAYSLTSSQMSPQHRGLPWSPWDSMDPHHHSLAFVCFSFCFPAVCGCLLPDRSYQKAGVIRGAVSSTLCLSAYSNTDHRCSVYLLNEALGWHVAISTAPSDADLREEHVQLPVEIDTLLCLSSQVAGLRLHPCSGYINPRHVLGQVTFSYPQDTAQSPSCSFESSPLAD